MCVYVCVCVHGCACWQLVVQSEGGHSVYTIDLVACRQGLVVQVLGP